MMTELDYYPFKNKTVTPSVEFLEELKEVPENWFVEYKVRSNGRQSLAKEFCALANQNGGYVFIGISDDGKGNVNGFPGIEPQNLQQVYKEIQLASELDCQPLINVEVQAFTGVNSFKMPTENSILMVIIPNGENTPHLHSSGVIYQRVFDKSQPVKDIHQYEQLIKRRNQFQSNIKQKLTRRAGLSESVLKQPYLFINLVPTNPDLKWRDVDRGILKELLQPNDDFRMFHVPLDYCASIDSGLLFAQRAANTPTIPLLSLNIYFDGSVRIDIPLNHFTISAPIEQVRNSNNFKRFSKCCHVQKFPSETKIINFTEAWAMTFSVIRDLFKIREHLGSECDYYYGAELINVGYSTGFLDNVEYIKYCENEGVPFCFENEIARPKRYDVNTLKHSTMSFDLKQYDESEHENEADNGIESNAMLLSSMVLLNVAPSLLGQEMSTLLQMFYDSSVSIIKRHTNIVDE